MAKKQEFLTVPEEVVEAANAIARHFRDWGFRIIIEPASHKYPMTPTLVAAKRDRTVIIDVRDTVIRSRLEDWVAYCASCDRNREMILCVSSKAALSAADHHTLGKLRVGLYRASADGVEEILRPVDLAMRAEMPKPENLPPAVRAILRDTYEHWSRGDWKDAFGLATEALEDHAKVYLKREWQRGRITVLSKKGKVLSLSPGNIDRMTLGALANAFVGIQAPTDVDSTVSIALNTINADRIRLRHFRNQKAASAGFRRRVGPHMHMIVRALREIVAKK